MAFVPSPGGVSIVTTVLPSDAENRILTLFAGDPAGNPVAK